MRLRGLCALCVLCVVTACSSAPSLFRQYEYEEDVYLSLDGSATIYVNSSLPALNALRGTTFDAGPEARVDTAAVRAYYTTPATRVTRVTQSRRSSRRFVHVRIDVDDVSRLGEAPPFAWSTYRFTHDGNLFKYLQTVGPATGKDPGNAGWTGAEIVAFRLHLPSKIRYHNTRRDVGRGNILVWEQPLADRLRGVPIELDARMDSQSILYTTLWLFGITFVAVAVAFCGVIWWVMRRGRDTRAGVASVVILCAGAIAPGPRPAVAASPTPVIVELFTSEGCADCPPADALLAKIVAAQPVAAAQIIGLGQHVDYWDRLGWKDRFSSAALTRRQQAYQSRFATESIYTPQMVVDGRAEFVGSDASAARKAIERAAAAAHGSLTVDISNAAAPLAPFDQAVHVAVTAADLPHSARGDRADIVVVVVESGLTTDVKRGENHGKVLSHAPVVRYLATIGQIAADESRAAAVADIPLAADWQRDRLAIVALVQEQHGRAILASASVAFKNPRP